MNAARSIEALDPDVNRRNTANFKPTSRDLVANESTVIDALVNDRARWLQEVKRVRNTEAAHHDPAASASAPARVLALAESLYLLAVLSLLRQTGADDAALASIADSQPFLRAQDLLERTARANSHHGTE